MISNLCCYYLGYTLPSIGRPPWLRDFYCWYGFLLGLALLYEPYGVGDCEGPYVLSGLLSACTCGTQHWGAKQYTHNHACSRIVYVLHTRVVTFGGKQYWFQLMNKKDPNKIYNQRNSLEVPTLYNPWAKSCKKFTGHP